MLATNNDVACKLDLVLCRLDALRLAADLINERVRAMSVELDNLREQVRNLTTVTSSVVTFIHGLAEQIEQLKTDPVALQQLADEVKGSADAIAAAIAENTPAPTP